MNDVVNRVHVMRIFRPFVLAQRFHHGLPDLFADVGPDIDRLAVAFAVGDQSLFVRLLCLSDETVRDRHFPFLDFRNLQVGRRETNARERRFVEALRLQAVQQRNRVRAVQDLVTIRDHLLQLALVERHVVERHALRQHVVEDHAADGGFEEVILRDHLSPVRTDDLAAFDADINLRAFAHAAFVVRQEHFFLGAELHALALDRLAFRRQEVGAHHDVQIRRDDRVAVRGREDVVGRNHQHPGFNLRFQRQRQMHRHLIAVEIGVESGAD